MSRRIATVAYFIVQAVAFCCALAVLADSMTSASTRVVATVIVVFYTLSTAGAKLAVLFTTRRNYDGKGVLDL